MTLPVFEIAQLLSANIFTPDDGLTGLLPDGDGQIIWDDYSYMSLKAQMYREQHPGTRVHLVKRRCEIVSVAPEKRTVTLMARNHKEWQQRIPNE